jgi:hypothetical protein
MSEIKEVLMRRDGMSSDQADQEIVEAKELLQEYIAAGNMEAAEDICAELWGLEPDYLMELM